MNDHPRNVRERDPVGGAAACHDDRRVQRTKRALVTAMVELVHERRWSAVTVAALLERAGVGRSTFYSHYRGKDDLLLRSFEQMLSAFDGALDRDGPDGRRVAPVRELFDHVGASRKFHRALVRAKMIERLFQAGADRIALTIERRLRALAARDGDGAGPSDAYPAPTMAAGPPRRAPPASERVAPSAPPAAEVPPDLLATALAGALFAMLRWWLEHEAPHDAAVMDAMFHALKLPAAST